MGVVAHWCIQDVMSFAAMTIVECCDMFVMTFAKAAMNQGMSNHVYIVYYNALATLICLLYFLVQGHSRTKTNCPPISASLLCRFFILGLLGICLVQVSAFTGIRLSSPTLAAALGNLVPAITFFLAIVSRMEKLDIRRSSSQAKLLGTVVAVSGAFVISLYKGPPILTTASSSSNSPHQFFLSQHSNWILGAFLIVFSCTIASTWSIVQTATIKLYPDEMTIVFFTCFFGTIQCAIFAFIMESDRRAWVLKPGIQMMSVVFSGTFGNVLHFGVITWCLNKKGPVYVAMFKPMGMVITVIIGCIFLNDTLHLGSVIGGTIIAFGFYTVMWGQAKEKDVAVDSMCNLETSDQSRPFLQ